MKSFSKIMILVFLAVFLVSGSSLAIPYDNNGLVVDNQPGYTWSDSAYWTFTDFSTAYDGESTFRLQIEYAGYESGFGLFTVDSVANPTQITEFHEVFSAGQEPSEYGTEQSVYFQNVGSSWYVSNDSNAALEDWTAFSNQFGFYFDVDAGANGSVDYSYYSDSTFNTVDKNEQHVAIQYDGTSKIFIHLEDLSTELGNNVDWDWEDMVVSGNDVAPVPEPATLFLLGSGLLGFAGIRRKKAKE